MTTTELPYLIERVEDEGLFEEILFAVARKGSLFRPFDFVWEVLPYSMRVKGVKIPERPQAEEISPVLIASFLKYGQLLPVWLDVTGRVIEGRARAVFFREATKYLVHPYLTTDSKRELIEVRNVEALKDCLKEIVESREGTWGGRTG